VGVLLEVSTILNFYDFEVFKNDWLVVIVNLYEQSETVIINDKEKLEAYYNAHKNEIWIGYNNGHYDQYIMKAILCDFDPKQVNDFIIVEGKHGWQFSSLFRRLPMHNFDVMYRNDRGLKSLEGFMGNNIKETSVPFNIDRKLTADEINETVKYCRHDVEQTIEVFFQRKDDFDAQMGLIKMFDLPLSNISRSKAQLSAIILDAKRPPHSRGDEFDISFPDTLRIEKYTHVLDWYKNPDNRDYSKSLTTNIAGVETIFGWGGIHSARKQYFGEGYFINMDVASLYPSLMIRYNLHSRNIKDPQKFIDIYHNRLKYKAEKNPLQLPLKTLLNSTYGCFKDKNNQLYDPLMANKICIYGQLLLLDLIEKLENHCEIIQSNTDGILIKLRKYDDYDLIDDIVYEWEQRTGLQMEFDEYRKVFQKDVNNYIVVSPDGKYKSKGSYVKKQNSLDYDLPIVNKAMIEFMINNVPIEITIMNCDDLIMFQKIVKLSGKFKHAIHNHEILNEKCFRVFASNNADDTYIGKQKDEGRTVEQFANTPEHCFIDNTDVKEKKTDDRLNKNWYINIAKKRLEQFGVI
jgi:DNA polymerase